MTLETRTKQGIGAAILRNEDHRLLRGQGPYLADVEVPNTLEVAFLRSPVAHAYIKGITVPEGAQHRVFVYSDLGDVLPMRAHSQAAGFQKSDYPAMANRKVRFVGEPIAMCIGATRAEAEDLAQQVCIDFDELAAITDVSQARDRSLPPLHDDWTDNVFVETKIDVGDVDRAKADAEVVVTREYRMNRQAMVSLEGRGVLAYWDDRADELVMYSSTQFPHVIRTALAECLKIEERSLRVIAPEVGGGFGVKNNLNAEEIAIAALALRLRKPLRWVEDRREHLLASAHAREHRYRVTAYADRTGMLLGIEAEIDVDAGAYSVWPWTAPMEAGMAIGFLPGAYAIRNYRARARTCASNKSPMGPYRGVGRVGACYAIERTIEELARAVDRDPCDVRIANYVKPEQFPWRSAGGKTYDCGDYAESARQARQAIAPERIEALRAEYAEQGLLVGVGYGTYLEQTAHGTDEWVQRGLPFVFGYETATARFTPDGTLILDAAIQNHGQGLETTLAQVAHEELGVDPARVIVRHGDTDIAPYGMGTFASRSMVMAGGAVGLACERLGEKVKIIGAHLLKEPVANVEIDAAKVVVRGAPGRSVDFREIARAAYLRPERLPPGTEPLLMATAAYRTERDTGAWSYGTHAVIVAVDPATGVVKILDYVIAHDCGTIVNPMIVEGQMMGGLAQGIGTALFEEMPYDANGQPLASTFMDYLVPGAPEVPDAKIIHLHVPSPITRYGIKGMGEGGAIPPPAAITNAVNHALSALGAEINETPMTPYRIIAAIQAARRQPAGEAR